MITTTTVAQPTASTATASTATASTPTASRQSADLTPEETARIEAARIEAIEDARPQFDAREDRALLGTVALIPGALLALGLGVGLTGRSDLVALALLAGHFLTQFIVLLVYGSLLMNDEGLDRTGRAMWVVGFLAAAPVALPLYSWYRVREPERREPRGIVRELPSRQLPGART